MKRRTGNVVLCFILILYILGSALMQSSNKVEAASSTVYVRFEKKSFQKNCWGNAEIKGESKKGSSYYVTCNYDGKDGITYYSAKGKKIDTSKTKNGAKNAYSIAIDTKKVTLSKVIINITVVGSGKIYSNKFTGNEKYNTSINDVKTSKKTSGWKIYNYVTSAHDEYCCESVNSNLDTLCIKDLKIKNGTSITRTFNIFESLDIGNTTQASCFKYASNGNVVQALPNSDSEYFNGQQTSYAKITTNNQDGVDNTSLNSINTSLAKFEKLINIATNFMLALAFLNSILAIIVNCLFLATLPSHPIQRRRVMFNFLYCFIDLAILGSITLFVKLLFQLIF